MTYILQWAIAWTAAGTATSTGFQSRASVAFGVLNVRQETPLGQSYVSVSRGGATSLILLIEV